MSDPKNTIIKITVTKEDGKEQIIVLQKGESCHIEVRYYYSVLDQFEQIEA